MAMGLMDGMRDSGGQRGKGKKSFDDQWLSRNQLQRGRQQAQANEQSKVWVATGAIFRWLHRNIVFTLVFVQDIKGSPAEADEPNKISVWTSPRFLFPPLFVPRPFISILFNNGYQAEEDIDEDGDVDFSDIIPFIPILSL